MGSTGRRCAASPASSVRRSATLPRGRAGSHHVGPLSSARMARRPTHRRGAHPPGRTLRRGTRSDHMARDQAPCVSAEREERGMKQRAEERGPVETREGDESLALCVGNVRVAHAPQHDCGCGRLALVTGDPTRQLVRLLECIGADSGIARQGELLPRRSGLLGHRGGPLPRARNARQARGRR